MALASNIKHRTLLYLVPVPCNAGGHTAGDVDRHKALATAWVTKHLGQAVALDVIVNDPLDLRELQAVCSRELKRQLILNWTCHALNLVFYCFQTLQAVQVIKVCWFGWQVRLRKVWINNLAKDKQSRGPTLCHPRVAICKLVIVSTNHDPGPRKHLFGTLGHLGQVATIKRYQHRVPSRLMDARASGKPLANKDHLPVSPQLVEPTLDLATL